MFNDLLTAWLRWLGGSPCFRVYGKTRRESLWRVIDIYATQRHDSASSWPFWRGTCITWTDKIIAVGWDFAEAVLSEQRTNPASRDHPVEVIGGRLSNVLRRAALGAPSIHTASEVLAHECGHTWQARHLEFAYLPLV